MQKKDVWDKIQIIGIILIGPCLVLAGNIYSSSIKEKEIQTKYVELALSILTTSSSKPNEELESWALDTINVNSEVKLSREAAGDIKKYLLLPEDIDIELRTNELKSFEDGVHYARYEIENRGKTAVTVEDLNLVVGGKCNYSVTEPSVIYGSTDMYGTFVPMNDILECLGVPESRISGHAHFFSLRDSIRWSSEKKRLSALIDSFELTFTVNNLKNKESFRYSGEIYAVPNTLH